MIDIKLSAGKTLFILGIIFFIGLLFRLIYFNQITFGFDQARDAFMALDIFIRDPIKIVGPGTEIPGLNHGILYWYLISPFYFFLRGSVYGVRLFLISINLLGIFILYFVAKKLFNNNLIGLLSAFVFATSFEAIQYGRWLSNPSPALILSLIIYYCYWLICNKNDKGIYIFIAVWPIALHFEFLLVYHLFFFLPLLVFFLIKRQLKINWKSLATSILIGLIIFSPFIVEQVKFHFTGIKGLILYLLRDRESNPSFVSGISVLIDRVANSFYINFGFFNQSLSGVIALVCLYKVASLLKEKSKYSKQLYFLFFWLLLPFFILLLFDKNLIYLTMGNLYAVIIIFVFVFVYLISKHEHYKKIAIFLFVIAILASNLLINVVQSSKGESLFSVQSKMLLNDQHRVIDYIYKSSNKEKFAINTITSPLFINTVWAYLFEWYGKPKYGYMPAWLGYPQVDVFGGNITMGLTQINVDYSHLDKQKNTVLYLIIEPKEGIPENYISAYKKFEDARSIILESKQIGNFTVEKRLLINEIPFSPDFIFRTAKGI